MDDFEKYYSATLDQTVNTGARAGFSPNVTIPGNYNVSMWTAACMQDDTCPDRGCINLTSTLTKAGETKLILNQLWQLQILRKVNQGFVGFVDAADATFKPQVILSPLSGQTPPSVIVAMVVSMSLLSTYSASTSKSASTSTASSSVSTSGLPTDTSSGSEGF
jgi:hypothetical protein